MTTIAARFALKNIKANRLVNIPFIISNGIMFLLYNVMVSLQSNEYVLSRHKDLVTFVQYGSWLILILAGVFILYSNRFLMSRRKQELALYSILGLEKRHIRRILFIELLVLFIFMTMISTLGGFIFGKLIFAGLNELLHDSGVKLMHYPFSGQAFVMTGIFELVFFLVLFVVNCSKIRSKAPLALLAGEKKGEKEPRSNWILLVIGLAALGYGYYQALHVDGFLSAMTQIVFAVLAVILATYSLFVSLSVIYLKFRRKRKSYYKAKNFLNISGLLYRMKSHAVGLASMAIMACGVILTLSTVFVMYSNMEKTVGGILHNRYYELNSVQVSEHTPSLADLQQWSSEVEEKARQATEPHTQVRDGIHITQLTTAVLYSNQELKPVFANQKDLSNPKDGFKTGFVVLGSLDEYNRYFGTDIKLSQGQALIYSNRDSMSDIKNLKIGNMTYQLSPGKTMVLSNFAVDYVFLVLPDQKTMLEVSDLLQAPDGMGMGTSTNPYFAWNAADRSEALDKAVKELNHDNFIATNQMDARNEVYSFNGGFLFLGLLVGLVFLIGTVLVTYYKQVNEAYEDREKYQIMKQVGLPDALIRRTAASQIVWLFFAPLIIAIIHCLAAGKIMSNLLILFGVSNMTFYMIRLGIVTVVFALIYLLIFFLTSRIYYRIVH